MSEKDSDSFMAVVHEIDLLKEYSLAYAAIAEGRGDLIKRNMFILAAFRLTESAKQAEIGVQTIHQLFDVMTKSEIKNYSKVTEEPSLQVESRRFTVIKN